MPFIKRHYAPKRKFCRFCEDKELVLDYKNTEVLKDFITERGKILARRVTGVCAKHQRQITKEIKRARNMALLIFTPTHDTAILKKSALREK